MIQWKCVHVLRILMLCQSGSSEQVPTSTATDAWTDLLCHSPVCAWHAEAAVLPAEQWRPYYAVGWCRISLILHARKLTRQNFATVQLDEIFFRYDTKE